MNRLACRHRRVAALLGLGGFEHKRMQPVAEFAFAPGPHLLHLANVLQEIARHIAK
jgi:hypothetical protein